MIIGCTGGIYFGNMLLKTDLVTFTKNRMSFSFDDDVYNIEMKAPFIIFEHNNTRHMALILTEREVATIHADLSRIYGPQFAGERKSAN